jgi:hypothetical protein
MGLDTEQPFFTSATERWACSWASRANDPNLSGKEKKSPEVQAPKPQRDTVKKVYSSRPSSPAPRPRRRTRCTSRSAC